MASTFGIEDDVRRVEAGLLGQQPVGALADRDFALDGVGLALLVERHDDDGRAVAADECAPCAGSRLRLPSARWS